MGNLTYNGVPITTESYDDAVALRAYAFRHFPHLLTALERRVTEYSAPIVSDSEHWKIRRLYTLLEERDGHVPDEVLLDALTTPYEDRKRLALDRLIAEQRDQMIENRCPKCERLVRTPSARQCLWCGHNWRDQ